MKDKNSKLLIVDDNPKNIQVLSGFLSENGYEFEYSINGAEALTWVDAEDFDLILLDIMMPEMDGFEVCEKIKSYTKNKDLPIIFLTAKTDIESISKAFSIGGVDYLTKPFNSQELIARVNTHIELKRSKDQLKEMNAGLEKLVDQRTHQLWKSMDDLAVANKELENLDQAKSEFMLLMSHEIRTPLNGILGGIQILKEYELPEETMEFLEMLDDSTKRLESFSMKTLEISQLRTMGKTLLKPEALRIADMLSDQMERNKSKTELKNLSTKVSVQDTLIMADSSYLHMALTELFDNAVYNSPKGGVIKVLVEETGDRVQCTILDQGEGFSEKILEKPIKSFYGSFHNIDQKKGLGLYLANQIIEAHGGSLSFGNREEGGAFVQLELLKA